MKESTTETAESGTEKQGFFKRIFTKIDTAMKEKAEQQDGSCCCETDSDKKSDDCCSGSNSDKETESKCC